MCANSGHTQHLKCMQSFEANRSSKERSSKGYCSLSAGKPGGKDNLSTERTFIHGAQSLRGCAHHAGLDVSIGSINSPRPHRKLSQEQNKMVPQIGPKARLQNRFKVHPAKGTKSRTRGKLPYIHGVHPGNTHNHVQNPCTWQSWRHGHH